MSYFANAKAVVFATKLFAAAGLDFGSLVAGKDENALKAVIEAAGKNAKADPELTASLEAAVAENKTLEGQLEAAEAKNAELAAKAAFADQLVAALDKSGIKASDAKDEKGALSAEKFDAAVEAAVAKQSRIALARVGHKPIDETPVTAPAAKKDSKLPANATGEDRLRHAMDQEIASSPVFLRRN